MGSRCDIRTFITLTVVAMGLSLSACKSPDLSPYVDATRQVRHSVREVTADTIGQLQRSGRLDDARTLAALRPTRDAALDAMVELIETGEAIGRSGERDGEAARRLGESLGRLAGLFAAPSHAQPLGRLAAIAARTAGEVRRASDLNDLLRSADPLLAALVAMLVDDMDDLARIRRAVDADPAPAIEAAEALRAWRRAYRKLVESRAAWRQLDVDKVVDRAQRAKRLLGLPSASPGAADRNANDPTVGRE